MLEDDRKKYGAGQLVKAVLNLKKGATKATGRATEEAKLQKEFDSLMKEHNKDLGKLDELKKSNATEKELTTLKDKIRNDIEDLMILEDSLDAFKNYSPGGRRLEATGGLLSDDRQAYGLGSIVKSFIKKNPSKSKEIKKLEKEMDSYLEDYRKLNDSYEQEIKNAKKEGMSVEEIKDIDETIHFLKGKVESIKNSNFDPYDAQSDNVNSDYRNSLKPLLGHWDELDLYGKRVFSNLELLGTIKKWMLTHKSPYFDYKRFLVYLKKTDMIWKQNFNDFYPNYKFENKELNNRV